MKKRITMKAVVNDYKKVYRCGYCDLQNIFYGIEADYYNAGVYGWNCDIYEIGNTAITTGYRNMRGERIPYEMIERYDKAAREIITDMWIDTNYKNRLEELRRDFLGELTTV